MASEPLTSKSCAECSQLRQALQEVLESTHSRAPAHYIAKKALGNKPHGNETSEQPDAVRAALQAFMDFQISDYYRQSEAARRYCEIRKQGRAALASNTQKANEHVDSVRVRVCDCNPVQAAECDEVENQTGTRPGYCRAENGGGSPT